MAWTRDGHHRPRSVERALPSSWKAHPDELPRLVDGLDHRDTVVLGTLAEYAIYGPRPSSDSDTLAAVAPVAAGTVVTAIVVGVGYWRDGC